MPPQVVKDTVNKHAFSGGRDTKEEQQKYGANVEIDIPYRWLTFFMEDDVELERIRADYQSGKMLTGCGKAARRAVPGLCCAAAPGPMLAAENAHPKPRGLCLNGAVAGVFREIKKILIDLLNDIIGKHQAARDQVTPEIVKVSPSHALHALTSRVMACEAALLMVSHFGRAFCLADLLSYDCLAQLLCDPGHHIIVPRGLIPPCNPRLDSHRVPFGWLVARCFAAAKLTSEE